MEVIYKCAVFEHKCDQQKTDCKNNNAVSRYGIVPWIKIKLSQNKFSRTSSQIFIQYLLYFISGKNGIVFSNIFYKSVPELL